MFNMWHRPKYKKYGNFHLKLTMYKIEMQIFISDPLKMSRLLKFGLSKALENLKVNFMKDDVVYRPL
jgi:hypothetical protein